MADSEMSDLFADAGKKKEAGILNPKFQTLKPDFSYLKELLQGKNLSDLGAKFHEPIPDARAFVIESGEGNVYVAGDLHGNLTDFRGVVAPFIADLAKGIKSWLVIQDFVDPLFEYKKDKLVVLSENHKDAASFIKRRIVLHDKDNKRLIALAYQDNSIAVLSEFLGLRKLFGNLVSAVASDHLKSLLHPNYEMYKNQFDFTNHVNSQLTPEEREFAKTALHKNPGAIKTENGYLIMHAGPVPMLKSWRELEELVYEYPLKRSDFPKGEEGTTEYGEKKRAWANGTIEGRLIFGRRDFNRECKGVKLKRIRVYSDEEIRKTLEGASNDRSGVEARKIIAGHTGAVHFIHETSDEELYRPPMVSKIREVGDLVIVHTTEGEHCEYPRSGENRDGPNNHGIYLRIPLNEEFGRVYLGKLGKPANTALDLKKNASKKQEKPIEKEEESVPTKLDIVDQISKETLRLVRINGFHPDLHYTFLKRKSKVRKLNEEGVISDEMLEETLKTLQNSEAKNCYPLLSEKGPYIRNVPEMIRKHGFSHS